MSQRIVITNVKDGQYKDVNLNTMFDPDHAHEHAYAFSNCTMASPFMGNKLFVTSYVLPPKKYNYPYHYHAGMEEVFYIISGTGVLQTPDGEVEVKEGDVVVMPCGEGGAHRLYNPSDDTPLVYLDVDAAQTQDVVFYPETGKVRVMTQQCMKSFKLDSEVNFLDGE